MKIRQFFYITLIFLFMLFNINKAFSADSASVEFCIQVPSFLTITPITSPVLIANITNRNGNLDMPLFAKFKVMTNRENTTQLYLQATTITEAGEEKAMFKRGNQVYIAFANCKIPPKPAALANCKYSSNPRESAGVVAYPVTSILGAQHQYNPAKQKYEVSVEQGTSYVTVNVGSNVLRTSFGPNDPQGAYQATLALTEADL